MKEILYPNVLQCNRFKAKSYSSDSRTVTDYELDYYIDGERRISIDGRSYKTSGGCIVFRKPGQFAQGTGDYNMYMLTLDFSQKKSTEPEAYVRGGNNRLQEQYDSEPLNTMPDVFYPKHSEDILQLFKTVSEYSYPNIINSELQQKAVAELLLLIFSDVYCYKREQSTQGENKTYVQQATEYIVKNYSKDISVDMLALELALNKNYLIKLFKKSMSVTPNKYITEVRLYHAELLLVGSDMSVQSIAEACGFNTTSYFIKRFKEAFGKTPYAYRSRIKSKEQ